MLFSTSIKPIHIRGKMDIECYYMTGRTEKGIKARPVEITIEISSPPSAETPAHASSDDLPLETQEFYLVFNLLGAFLKFSFSTSQITANSPSQNLVYLVLPNFESVLF